MSPAELLGPEFPLSDLLSRFRELWAQQRESMEKPVTRIASFNLLIVSDGKSEDELWDVLQGLQASHPARVIWTKIDADRNWEDSKARLHLGSRCDGEQVCSEHIQILCGDQPERVSSLILPLIREGLPTHLLWWKAGDTQGPLFERLADRCRLVLLDGLDWSHVQEVMPKLWEDPNRAEHAFFPSTWFQLTQARQHIASAYSHSDIELTLSAAEESQAFSDLLDTWLKSTLKSESRDRSWAAEGLRVTAGGGETVMTSSANSLTLELEEPLCAIRQALDKPLRDPVFERVVKYWKENPTCLK